MAYDETYTGPEQVEVLIKYLDEETSTTKPLCYAHAGDAC